jgi:Zn-dependent protease with chaperone function
MAAASQGGGQEWMSTHPDPSRRARELKAYIETKGYAKF